MTFQRKRFVDDPDWIENRDFVVSEVQAIKDEWRRVDDAEIKITDVAGPDRLLNFRISRERFAHFDCLADALLAIDMEEHQLRFNQ